MTHITFYSDGSHVHQPGTSGQTVHYQDCEESRRVRRLLDTDFDSIFENAFRNFDRQMEALDRQMEGLDRAFNREIQQSQPCLPNPQIRIRITTPQTQPQAARPVQEPVNPVAVDANVSVAKTNQGSTVLSTCLIAAAVLGLGYVGYQNGDTIAAFARSVPSALGEAGHTAWSYMQEAWQKASCRFSYAGCP